MIINKILASKKHIKLNNKTTHIEYEQFKDNKILENIDLDNGKLAKISYAAFKDCTSLKEIFIPKTVRYIDEDVFEGCYNLEKIEVSENNEFYDSRNNCNAIIDNTLHAIIYGCKNTIIPEDGDINCIEDSAFYKQYFLRKINIPDNINIIKRFAFANCESLEEISFPKSLITIAPQAFCNCTSLKNIFINNVEIISKGAFEACVALETVRLGEGCTCIMDDVFANCLKLKKIYLPSTICDFPPSALKNCPELNEIIIPKNSNFNFNCISKNIKITKVDYDTINEYYNSLDFLLQENKSIKEINRIYKEQEIEK